MNIADFDFELPADRIAAQPAARRDDSRLLVLPRETGETTHTKFSAVAAHLPPRSLLVLNDTRVIRARLRGRKRTGGATELLLTRCVSCADGSEVWEALAKNLAGTSVGDVLDLAGDTRARLLDRQADGRVLVALTPPDGETVLDLLERVGELPLPPYIVAARRRSPRPDGAPPFGVLHETHAQEPRDDERYQTVYARVPGAVAAPTAGLHFTEQLLAQLTSAGHEVVSLTLHVGPGTFKPVKVEDPAQHEMDPEWYTISPETAAAVETARRSRRPIVAVGTTVVRALESAARVTGGENGQVNAGTAASALFLYPGARFHVVTDLITNFHLPRSTLLMLVSAFAGRERVLAAYRAAVAAGYRFYSYGDAMLIRGTPC